MSSRPPRAACLGLVALALSTLAACAHEPPRHPAAHGLPMPLSWGIAPPVHPPFDSFDRGVPEFHPPTAADCRRSPGVREQHGGADPGQTSVRPGRAGARSEAIGRAMEPESRDAAAVAAPAAPAPAAKSEAAPRELYADRRDGGVAGANGMPAQRPRPGATVSAGMIDDNADFAEYLAFRERGAGLHLRRRDVTERYRVEVRDALDRPVPDAELALAWAGAPGQGASSTVWARSDAGGTAWLHPRAVLPPEADGRSLEVQVRAPAAHGAYQTARATLQRGQRHNVVLRLASPAPVAGPRLDLVFLVDATGSMADEIAKLKASMASIADQIGAMPGRPELCYGLVGYRDRGDAFLTRTHDFTDRLPEFQSVLARLQASAGGDYPEAVNEALAEAVHGLSWRGGAATRLVVLIADAPPHLDYGGVQYDATAAAALAKGIKLHAVGASGLDPQGEAVFRQIAQYTGGRFVFLTYRDAADPSSGPGSETVHDVRGYSVDTLDRLIVRLVREELARRPV